MVYAYLQLGQDKNARAVDRGDGCRSTNFNPELFGGHLCPGGVARRATRWSAATGRAAAATGGPRQQVPPGRWRSHISPVHWVRRAAGKPEAAKADVAKLAELRGQAARGKGRLLGRTLSISSGRLRMPGSFTPKDSHDEALKAMSGRRAMPRTRPKSQPVTPGPLAPARELYGAMLLDRGMAKEALAAFEADAQEGAAPARRHRWRGQVRGEGGRNREGAQILCGCRCAHGECRSGRATNRARAGLLARSTELVVIAAC